MSPYTTSALDGLRGWAVQSWRDCRMRTFFMMKGLSNTMLALESVWYGAVSKNCVRCEATHVLIALFTTGMKVAFPLRARSQCEVIVFSHTHCAHPSSVQCAPAPVHANCAPQSSLSCSAHLRQVSCDTVSCVWVWVRTCARLCVCSGKPTAATKNAGCETYQECAPTLHIKPYMIRTCIIKQYTIRNVCRVSVFLSALYAKYP